MKSARALGGGWNWARAARVCSPIVVAVAGSLGASWAKADLFVADGDIVRRFDASTGAVIQTNGQNPFTSLFTATGVAVGPDALVYAATSNPGLDPNLAVVNRYNASNGQKIGNGFVPFTNGPSQVNVAAGLAFGPDGSLYIADAGGNGAVMVFDAAGAFATSYTPQGGNPQAVAFDPLLPGNMYVATGSTIESFNLITHANAIVVQGMTGTFSAGMDLAFSSDGKLFVLDASSSSGPQILRYNADGTGQAVYSSFASTLFQPTNLAFGPDGLLYVSGIDLNALSAQQGEILRLSADGSSSSVFVSNLDTPGFLSFSAVPEPGSMMLLVICTASMTLRRRTR